jgi:transketolase
MSLIASFAAFITCNAYDQLRMSVSYPNLNVKVVGSHAGISIGEDGASQMGIEDVALMCSLPNFVVVVPADEESARSATAAMLRHKGPVYLRVGRPDVPKIYTGAPAPFTIGEANKLRDGTTSPWSPTA